MRAAYATNNDLIMEVSSRSDHETNSNIGLGRYAAAATASLLSACCTSAGVCAGEHSTTVDAEAVAKDNWRQFMSKNPAAEPVHAAYPNLSLKEFPCLTIARPHVPSGAQAPSGDPHCAVHG